MWDKPLPKSDGKELQDLLQLIDSKPKSALISPKTTRTSRLQYRKWTADQEARGGLPLGLQSGCVPLASQ